MNHSFKIVLCVFSSTFKAIANTFVYLFSIVIVRALLFPNINLRIFNDLSMTILIILAIVFVNDWIKNFKVLCPTQQTKQGNNREGERLGKPLAQVKDSDKPAETNVKKAKENIPEEKPELKEGVIWD